MPPLFAQSCDPLRAKSLLPITKIISCDRAYPDARIEMHVIK
jgi:hypothetical protein